MSRARPAASARPTAATWPRAGAPRTTISRIACATSPADSQVDLDQLVGEASLVDEDERVGLEAERAAEAARRAVDARRRAAARPRRRGAGRGRRVGQDRARHLLRRLAQGAGGADERGRGPHRVARHRARKKRAAGEAERLVGRRLRRRWSGADARPDWVAVPDGSGSLDVASVDG